MNGLSLKQLTTQAETAFHSRQFTQAAQLFEQAAGAYTNAGDVLNAAEMNSNRSVALLQADDPREALQAVQGLERVFALAGDIRRQALALGNEAAALEALNQSKLALEKYQQSADLLKQSGDQETRVLVLKSISQLQMRMGHHLQALSSMDAALDNQKRPSLTERLLKRLIKVPFQMLKRGG
jgi:tetratricopeptide (TPR) repeat protein